jgi:type II secretory pathway component PulF
MQQALTDMEPNFRDTRHPMHEVVSTLLFRLRGGGPDVPGVLKRTVGTELMAMIPPEEAMLIQAGEKTAKVAEGFNHAADLVIAKDKMTSQVWSLLRKPAGYIALLMLMFVFFHIQLIPSYERTHPRATWPSHAKALGWFTDHIYVINVLVLLVLGATAFFFIEVVPRWTGARRERLDGHFPFNLIASLNGVAFLKSLSAYTGAGLSASVSIPAIAASGTPYIKWQCAKIDALLRQGLRLEEALSRLAIIPRRFHWIIAVYSKLNNASDAYNRMAESMTKEVSKTLELYFGQVLGNIIFLVLTGATIFVWSTFAGIATARG